MKKSEWDYNHFESSEFDCHCADCKGKDTGLEMDKNFMESLSMARASAQVPFRIQKGCGYRCETHNKKIGGSETSEHCKGLAVDIPYYNEQECLRIIYGLINAGFKRIQIYEYKNKKGRGWIHVDKSRMEFKPQEWLSIKHV